MVATRATAIGVDENWTKEATRLGSKFSIGKAQTWRTFASVAVDFEGMVEVTVVRDGEVIHRWKAGPE